MAKYNVTIIMTDRGIGILTMTTTTFEAYGIIIIAKLKVKSAYTAKKTKKNDGSFGIYTENIFVYIKPGLVSSMIVDSNTL